MSEEKTVTDQEMEEVAGGIKLPPLTALYRCYQCGAEQRLEVTTRLYYCSKCRLPMGVVSGSETRGQE